MQTPFTPVWCLSAAGRSSALLSLPHGEMERSGDNFYFHVAHWPQGFACRVVDLAIRPWPEGATTIVKRQW